LASSAEWNIVPQVTPRAECGYVGLKNGGATCYMNAVLQQLYAIPGLVDYVLSTIDEDSTRTDVGGGGTGGGGGGDGGGGGEGSGGGGGGNQTSRSTSVYWQLQSVLAHLKESRLEYYVPESFWKVFRMWGQEVNLREQQDAFDFFISMTDQIDEHLKKMKREPVFKSVFEGTFSNQFICTDCPHKWV
jgi:ubiquitin carboxyl-terminal hydrolase 9/24